MTGCVLPLGLFILLYFTLNEVANGCDPMATPWDRECKSRCENYDTSALLLYGCSINSLPSGNYSGGNNSLFIKFWRSDISTVSSQAFSGLIASKLGFEHSFTSFAPNTFDNLNVKELHIRYNTKLLSLPSEIFRGVKGLEAINLGRNKLKSLPGDIFQDLGDLKKLNLAGNEISCLHQDLFQPLYSLKTLYINQSVAVKGLCGRTFRGLLPEVKDYHAEVDYCVMLCSGDGGDREGKVKGLKVCNCSSAIGCYTCTGDEKVIPTSPSTLSPTPPPTTLSPTPPPTTLSPTLPPSTLSPTPTPSTLSPTPPPSTLSPTPPPTTLSPTPPPTTLSPTPPPSTLSTTLPPSTLSPTPTPSTLSPTPPPSTLSPTPPPSTLSPTLPTSRLSTTLPPSRLSTTLPPSRLSPTPQAAVLTEPRPKPTSSGVAKVVQEFSAWSVLMPILINTIMTYLETAP